jgi:hypothetical protein
MDDKVHNQPSDIDAVEGAVSVAGPDGVSVMLTPEAAEETSHRLLEGAAVAKGQQRVEEVRQSGARRKLDGR